MESKLVLSLFIFIYLLFFFFGFHLQRQTYIMMAQYASLSSVDAS